MAVTLPTLDGAKDVPALVRLLRGWGDALARALRLPALSERGVLLQSVALSAGSTAVDHGLGRAPSGWLVVRSRGAAGAAIAEVSSDARSLVLTATAAVSVDLWVWP